MYPPDFKPSKAPKKAQPKFINLKSAEHVEDNPDDSSPDEDFNYHASYPPKLNVPNLLSKKSTHLTSTPAKGSPSTPKSPEVELETPVSEEANPSSSSQKPVEAEDGSNSKVVTISTPVSAAEENKDSSSIKPGIEDITPVTTPQSQPEDQPKSSKEG